MVKNQIIFSKTQFIGVLLGAVITASVGTVFATVRILNSDHYALIALSRQVEQNDKKDNDEHKTFVTREELKELVIARMDRIQASVDRLK